MLRLNKFSPTYIYVKLVKQSGSPDYIARGVAIGFMVGMVIPFGLQMPIAILLALILKAAKIPSLACTWVTNHITIFFIYPIQCWIGSYLIGNPLQLAKLEKQLENVINEQTWASLNALGGQLIAAFFAGGFLFGIILAVPGYFFSLYWVKKYRELKELKLKRRREKLKAAQST